MMEIKLPTSGMVVRPGKLIAIGRNYAAHAAEMKSETPENPVIFLKPSTALVGQGGKVILPSMTRDVHHEIEVVAAIGRGGKHIPVEEALNHVDGYALGLDMTARDLQADAKQNGLPWSVAKGFDTFAPLGPFAKAHDVGDPQTLDFELRVNGDVRQKGRTAEMIFPVAYLISYCSSIFTLLPGDLIYTGTPSGVGPVQTGDLLEAKCTRIPDLRVKVRRET